MSRFAHVLQKADRELTLVEPQRSRILLELSQDLEDLYASYREQGYDDATAARRVEKTLGLSEQAAAALTELHSPWIERLLGRIEDRSRSTLDTTVLTLLTLMALASAWAALVRSPRLGSVPDVFVFALLGVMGAAAWCAGCVLIRRSVKLDPARARAPLGALPPLAGFALLIGSLGAVIELRLLTDSNATIPAIAATVARAFELLVFSVCMTMLIALVWFHLRRRVTVALSARAALAASLHPLTDERR